MSLSELNTQCVKRIREADLDKCVAVVGSGLSNPFIAPLDGLRGLIRERCKIRERRAREWFWDFCERAYKNNRRAYFKVIKGTYSNTPEWRANAYRHIVNMPFQGFVTLNYDDQMPNAFRDRFADSHEDCFSVYPARNSQDELKGRSIHFSPMELLERPPKLVAIHGYCDDENEEWEKQVILRTGDYNTHYVKYPVLFDWWRVLLVTVPCIFIGTSLKEPGLFRVMQYLQKYEPDRLQTQRHIHLCPEVTPKAGKLPDPGISLGVIERVYYDRIDEKFTGLNDVLAVFSGQKTGRPSPRIVGPSEITATDTYEF